MFKNVLFAVLSVLIPFLFTALTDAYPDFPLAQLEFVETILWAVGLVIGGWNVKAARLAYLDGKFFEKSGRK